jgi:hypothetical protein
MKWTARKPCASCPYRKDVPIGTWHRSEFENLLANDADEMNGSLFGCHKYRHRPPEEHEACVGWVLDQKARGIPAIRLRMALMTNEEAVTLLQEATDGGHPLHASLHAMCFANGARVPRRKCDNDDWEEDP